MVISMVMEEKKVLRNSKKKIYGNSKKSTLIVYLKSVYKSA
mgnify:CR=1 FL=1